MTVNKNIVIIIIYLVKIILLHYIIMAYFMKDGSTIVVNIGYILCSISFYLGFLDAFKNFKGGQCKRL